MNICSAESAVYWGKTWWLCETVVSQPFFSIDICLLNGTMLATLSRLKSPRLLSPEIFLGYILGQEVRSKKLSLLSHSLPVSAAVRQKVTAGSRDVSSSCSLCAKARGQPKKRELSEKKLVCVWDNGIHFSQPRDLNQPTIGIQTEINEQLFQRAKAWMESVHYMWNGNVICPSSSQNKTYFSEVGSFPQPVFL